MTKKMCPTNITQLSTAVLALPEKAVTNAGFEYWPQDDQWVIYDQSHSYNFNFSELLSYCDKGLIAALKKVLVFYLGQKSASHPSNIFCRFKHFVQTVGDYSNLPLTSISSTHIINYKGNLSQHQQWYLTTLSGFFKKWHALGYPGIEPEVPALFKQLRLKGNPKGDAVRTMDPKKGPYTDIELQALHSALNDAFAEGRIKTRSYLLAWLFMALGARNVQFAALKIKDFIVQRASDGTPSYFLNVPRAKQRGCLIRDQLKKRPLISELGKVLELWIGQVELEYTECVGDGCVEEAIKTGDLPIFPKWNKPNPAGFEHHANGADLSIEIQQIFKKLKVTSERTGKQIHVNTRRFRYTLGTRAAMEGHGELIIADLLDHSDTQQVGVYVEATPEIIDRIDKALALQLAPLAQAFAGVIVTDEWEAERGEDPSSRIRSPKTDPAKGGLGTCGKYGFCGAFAPIACYTCRNFQAWLDGPHEEVLDDLFAERERLLKETGDERIAFANDRTIYAVAEVLRKCNEIKQQMEVG